MFLVGLNLQSLRCQLLTIRWQVRCTNYDTWAFDIKLWLKGYDYVGHLIDRVASIDEKEHPRWTKVDTQICSIFQSTIHPSVTHETCSGVWEQAQMLYINDTQCLCCLPQSLDYHSPLSHWWLHGWVLRKSPWYFLHDFNELLPPASTPAQELKQQQTFFMLMTLYGLSRRICISLWSYFRISNYAHLDLHLGKDEYSISWQMS